MRTIDLIHQTMNANGINLHYVQAGNGEQAIVLLHGSPKTWYEWRLIIPALAQHFTVIAPDLRGFGDSDKPESGYDKKTIAQDIHQLVSQLGFTSIYLVGHGTTHCPHWSIGRTHQRSRALGLASIH
jgi:pimeloyl-ACP methyl ester carboxylesterase